MVDLFLCAGKPVLESLGLGAVGAAAGVRSLISPTKLKSEATSPACELNGLGVNSSASRSSSNLWPRNDMSEQKTDRVQWMAKLRIKVDLQIDLRLVVKVEG